MTWTHERPTQPGWYWWREVNGVGKVLFQVVQEIYNLNGRLFASDCGNLNDVHTKRSQWAGPILPPGEGV